MALRSYQETLKNDIYDAWRSGQRNILAVSPTGSGKTTVISSIFEDMNRDCGMAIAHRQELVAQISCTLARDGIYHNILAPDNVIRFIIHLHIERFGKNFYHRSAPTTVAGIQTILARKDQNAQLLQRQSVWQLDECFPRGTAISTPFGPKPVEEIEIGDVVISWNEKNHSFEHREVVRLFSNPLPDNLMEIKAGGRVTRCTRNHPFLTQRGWVNAENLGPGDSVFLHDLCRGHTGAERAAEVSISQSRLDFLLQRTWMGVSTTDTEAAPESNHIRRMRAMWKRVSAREASSKDLQRNVSIVDQQRHDVANKSEICIGSYDGKQPHARPRESRKNERDVAKNWTQTISSRRQWETQNERGRNVVFLSRRAGVRGRVPDQNWNGSKIWLSDMLQTRHRSSTVEDCGGSGRCEPSGQGAYRSEKGRFSSFVRLDSVSVYKSRNHDEPVGDLVYNFEVEGTHTYVADGFVVHNCHHAARDTIWWKGVHLMPRAVGVGWTGTPRRTDKKPLGRTFGGLFDQMVIGPTYRYLIDNGYLCKYRIFAPPSSVDLSHVEISKRTGDFNETEKNKATEKSQVVGDIVEQYLKIAPGKIGITFVPTVKLAQETAQRFVQRGVPAECVHGGSDSAFRVRSIAQHARGELKQLVNVGLFGEGFDVPVCEVVSDGDATMSLTDFMQRFGRMLRPANGKQYGIYIDHVENVIRHGLPDAPRAWSLDVDYRGSKRGRDESVMPVRTCMQCDGAYEAITRVCPYCGYVDTPSASARNDPAQVDGDLYEMSPELLARLRGDIEQNEQIWDRTVNNPREGAMRKNMNIRHDTLQELRQVINYWAGVQVYGMGRSESEAYSRYFHRFGVDVLTAQTLTTPEMRSLIDKIRVDTI